MLFEIGRRFRQMVRAWLGQHVPRDVDIPLDGGPLDPEIQERIKVFRRQVGEQGWLAPTWPKAYGGGGLSPSLALVVQEEMQALELPPMGDNSRWIPAMMTWGTEAQKQRYIVPSFRGETITWQAFNEPAGGSDLASVRTRADVEGDDYLITGEKAFITGRFTPDYLWTLVVTDSNRPPRANLGLFMIDARLPGVTIKTQRLLMGSERRIFLDHVRVPAACLVGPPYQGWEIVQSILEEERSGLSQFSDGETMEDVLQYIKDEIDRR